MRIYLIGYSYSGKTTLGRQLAGRLGYTFFDTDKAIELKYRTNIPVFFQRYGEPAFRIIERQILQSTAEMDDVVVSTGGGTPCNDENIAFILEHGKTVHMEMSVDDVLQRISHARKKRPLLINKGPEELRQYIEEQLGKRLPFYRQASLSLPAINATVDDLLRCITER